MEIQKASVKKIALPYGAVLGLVTVLLSVVVYVMDLTYEQPWWQGVLAMIMIIVCTVMGIKAFKKDNSGFLSLGEAIKVGLAIALIASIIGVAFNLVFMNFIEPDFTANMLAAAETNMLEQNPNMTQEQIDMARVKSASVKSNISSFIDDLDEGYDSHVGEQGIRLSGGQRQRIGIARALYKNAKILVFDEATSALDGNTEKSVMEAIKGLSNHSTIIMIAHRLTTVESCDKLILLDDGKVVEYGSPAYVLPKVPKY